ncbi:protein ras-1 [Reticulomyxa filosa]|uniref:Protein ras-1 n=1 Tax=Reticulomyxa filosa TaxID=46433 RepID=X6NFY1_RETFI|nr:protein ras-1 [Reticulomyxa filosa]|eukprot:ETO25235.1 protein ras-1 [Reticulomyxa filosa]
MNILMLGHDKSGKTSLVIRLIANLFLEDYDSAVEESYKKKIRLNDEQSCFLHILDTPGAEEFSTMHKQWVFSSDCVIIAYDASGPYPPEQAIQPYLSIIRRTNDNVTTIVAGTKTDLRHNFSKYKHNLDVVVDFCKRNCLCYIETSAKDNINIQFLFQFVFKCYLWHYLLTFYQIIIFFFLGVILLT